MTVSKRVLMQLNHKFIARRAVCYLAGLFFIAMGINISKAGGLGISPVSATAYAIEKIWGIELGMASNIVLACVLGIQALILGRKTRLTLLLQLPVLVILGYFITITSRNYFLMSWLPDPSNYVIALIYTILSAAVIGIGVSLYLVPKWTPMPPEGLAVVISDKWQEIPIHTGKNIVDLSMVVVAVILSLIFTGKVEAVREGTVIVAILVGRFVGICNKIYGKQLQTFTGRSK